jgi:glycine betaine/proline transport system substrate-binding protein
MMLSTALAAAVSVMALAAPASADVTESTDPIKIVTNNWTSQLVLAHVVGDLLEDMGYNVEYVPSKY